MGITPSLAHLAARKAGDSKSEARGTLAVSSKGQGMYRHIRRKSIISGA